MEKEKKIDLNVLKTKIKNLRKNNPLKSAAFQTAVHIGVATATGGLSLIVSAPIVGAQAYRNQNGIKKSFKAALDNKKPIKERVSEISNTLKNSDKTTNLQPIKNFRKNKPLASAALQTVGHITAAALTGGVSLIATVPIVSIQAYNNQNGIKKSFKAALDNKKPIKERVSEISNTLKNSNKKNFRKDKPIASASIQATAHAVGFAVTGGVSSFITVGALVLQRKSILSNIKSATDYLMKKDPKTIIKKPAKVIGIKLDKTKDAIKNIANEANKASSQLRGTSKSMGKLLTREKSLTKPRRMSI